MSIHMVCFNVFVLIVKKFHRGRSFAALRMTGRMRIGVNDAAVIGINLKPNRGFRRGESGWVDGRWVFMVARCGSPKDIGSSMLGPHPHPRATIKAHPIPHHPPSPLRLSLGFP